jgi:hypothetical protein
VGLETFHPLNADEAAWESFWRLLEYAGKRQNRPTILDIGNRFRENHPPALHFFYFAFVITDDGLLVRKKEIKDCKKWKSPKHPDASATYNYVSRSRGWYPRRLHLPIVMEGKWDPECQNLTEEPVILNWENACWQLVYMMLLLESRFKFENNEASEVAKAIKYLRDEAVKRAKSDITSHWVMDYNHLAERLGIEKISIV